MSSDDHNCSICGAAATQAVLSSVLVDCSEPITLTSPSGEYEPRCDRHGQTQEVDVTHYMLQGE